METEEKFITEKHLKARNLFRVIGPLCLGIGIILIIIAFVDFFGAFRSHGGMWDDGFGGMHMGMHDMGGPDKFWMFFLAIPFIGAGSVLTKFGYGAVAARYVAREYSPVASDTINYIAKETAPGVKEVAKALRDENNQKETSHCPQCSSENPANAKFCNSCGSHLMRNCSSCNHVNSIDARFCNECGKVYKRRKYYRSINKE